jgi:hypothetical protein
MKITAFKNTLEKIKELHFEMPDGSLIPSYFHITEVGKTTKHFIDCGGSIHTDHFANFQLWFDERDTEHRLTPSKLLHIIGLSEKLLGHDDLEIEVEYQNETIGKYGLELQNGIFRLTNKNTDCLAIEKCGIPPMAKAGEFIGIISKENACCTPGTCC